MKNLFRGYFADNKETIDSLWSECFFVFDANILLNLYRYSDSTRKEFLHILQTIKHRIWLPNRAAEEYFKNRIKVIYDQSKAYDDTISKINALKQMFENSRSHPFISDLTKEKTEEVFTLLTDELKDSKKIHSTRITNDQIKEQLAKLFEGRVGQPFSEDALKKILDDGKKRYLEQIPPGFEDADKADENVDSTTISDRCRRYGDYIIWSQILEFAESNKNNVILISDDNKKDWWEVHNKLTINPRPELIEEFFNKTGQKFFMYKPDKFLEFSKLYLNESVTSEAVDEVRELRKKDQTENFTQNHSMLHSLAFDLDFINQRIAELRKQDANIDAQVCKLDSKLNELWENNEATDDEKEVVVDKLNELFKKHKSIEREILELTKKRSALLDWLLDTNIIPNTKYKTSSKS